MTELHTNKELLKALRDSASRKLSPRTVDRQRLSFVMGMLSTKNDMTREEVQRVLEKHEGRKFAVE